MAKKDLSQKLLTSDNEVFAELFNKLIFMDEVVDPGKLKERDPEEIIDISEKQLAEQKYRDILKFAEIMVDDRFGYLLLGIENQSYIHYAMPIRVLLYDAINYSRQISAKTNREKYSGNEFLSGISKDELIIPVITLVINWNPDQWDGPISLHDMMDKDIVREYGDIIEDYKLHLVSVCELSDEFLKGFKTEIGLALEFSKYSRDKNRILGYNKDDRFRNKSNAFVATINAMTDSRFKLNETGGPVDMCQAILEIQEDVRKEYEAILRNKEDAFVKIMNEKDKSLIDYFISEGLSREEAIRKMQMIFSDTGNSESNRS